MYELLSDREDNVKKEIRFKDFSQKCRNQLISVIVEAIDSINDSGYSYSSWIYHRVVKNMGLEPCSSRYYSTTDLQNMAKSLDDSDFKDMVDLICQILFDASKRGYLDFNEYSKEIDQCLKQGGIGYKVYEGKLIKVFDENEYAKIIEPCFSLLKRLELDAAHEHLTHAFEHWNNAENEAALVEFTKSLELTVATISEHLGIPYNDKEKLPSKIKPLMEKGLIPNYMEQHFTDLDHLVSLLSSSAAIRNHEGAHGKSVAETVPDHYVQCALDMTMSAILFIARCWEESKD